MMEQETCRQVAVNDNSSETKGGLPPTISHSCTHCTQGNATSRCSKCKLVYYCGKECQQAHWKVHKKICLTLGNVAASPSGPTNIPATMSNEPMEVDDQGKPISSMYI